MGHPVPKWEPQLVDLKTIRGYRKEKPYYFIRMIKHRVKGKIEQSPGRFNQRQKMLRQQLEEL